MKKSVLFLLVGLLLAGCSSDDIQNRQLERQNKQGVLKIGVPAINRFFEKNLLKTIYELRDQGGPTYTYVQDFQGHLHFRCNSFGYGIPYSMQYSTEHTAEPNGLYPPGSAAGTWVLCQNPNPGTNDSSPVYIEDNMQVYRWKMPHALPY